MMPGQHVGTVGRVIAALLISAPFIIWGCSSGGGSKESVTPLPTPSDSVITGTVPGTIIHAYGDDGSYYSTETNSADPQPRPFSLTVKPGVGYRLVLEESGAYYPVVFDAGSTRGDTTRFYMSLVGGALDLGLVSPNTSTGTAAPQHNPLDRVDTDGDGIVDRADTDFTLPASDTLDADGDGVPNPVDPDYHPAPGDADGDGILDAQDLDIDNDGIQNSDDSDVNGVTESIDTLLARATTQILARNVLGASQSFQSIVTRNPNHQLGNLGLAITRIGAVLTDMNPGTDSSKLETMKEVLDRLGFPAEGRDLSNFTAQPPVISNDVDDGYGYLHTVSCYVFPEDSPTSQELLAYLNEQVAPQIEAALGNLDRITPDFTYTPSTPIVVAGTAVTGEIDYSDVLALKAALRGALTFLTLLNAYDLDIDLDEFLNNELCEKVNPSTYHGVSPQALLTQYPNLLTLTKPAALSNLKALATGMMDDAIAALESINGETDDQANDLLTTDAAMYLADRAYLEQIKATFNGPVTVSYGPGSDSLRWNSTPIFAGINLRSYIPALMGNQVVYASIRSASYNPTIGGVLPDFTAEDVIRLVDHRAPTVTFPGLSTNVSNPITLQVRVDDTETLPDGTTQVGSGINPTSLMVWWNCWPAEYSTEPYTGCTLSGQSGGSPVTTPGSYDDITLLFGAPSAIGGVYTWTPNGGSVTVNMGGATSINNYVWVLVQDRAGMSGWEYTDFTVP